jgi:hypothetical protein
MKAIVTPLALLALLVGAAQDPKPDEDSAKKEDAARKAQRIDQAVTWLVNEDADVREMGRKTLMEIGRDALPAIEKKLAERKADDLARVLRALDRGPAPGEAWVPDKDLKDIEVDEQFKREAEKLPKDTIDKIMYLKYQEALTHYRGKNYQRSFDMANALMVLDQRGANYDRYKLLRRQSETMITQTSLIEAKVLQPKKWYVEGEPVELSVRLKNLYRNEMMLLWDKGTEKEQGGGLLLLDVDVTLRDMGGASMSDQRHQDLRFEESVPIAPGAQWEKKFTLDVSTTIPDVRQIRSVTVGGWSQPAKISTDGVNITRRIQFEPAVVKVIPKKYERFLDHPLTWLEKMIAEGDPQEVYICSQLLEGEEKDKGAEMLIHLLAKAQSLTGKTDAANILNGLTGQSFGNDPKRWEAWLQNKMLNGKDNKKK